MNVSCRKFICTASCLLGTLGFLSADSLELKQIAEKLSKPVEVRGHIANKNLIYIIEKTGSIQVYDSTKGRLATQPFLDISDRVQSKASEQGLLSIAFPKDFSKSQRFYAYYTNRDGDSHLSRFKVKDALTADPSSEEVLLTEKQDYRNHNGGALRFGPDGMLYVSLGDGGAGNDPKKRSQDLGSLLGKLLRIDVSPAQGYKIPADNPFTKTQGARAEILSYGLRNPWRICWEKDILYIADVGQNKYEEIHAIAYQDLFSANLGWPQWEAFKATKNKPRKTNNPGKLIQPVYAYKRGTSDYQGFSITGAAVANQTYPTLAGRFLFADYVSNHFWSGTLDSGKLKGVRQHTLKLNGKEITVKQISSIDRSPSGKLYISSLQGKVYEIQR